MWGFEEGFASVVGRSARAGLNRLLRAGLLVPRLLMRGLLLPVLLVLVAGGTVAAAEVAVTDVRVGQHPDKTRFVMELSGAPSYRIFTLPDPFRVVIDLPPVAWQPKSERLSRKSGLISAMRFGQFGAASSRVVLDVRGPTRIKEAFLLPPGDGHAHRLVIDLVGVSRAAFFANRQSEPMVAGTPPAKGATTAAPLPIPAADVRPTIVIDPGHGGVDPGARSISGVDEKVIALQYAKELQRQLLATGRYRVVLTRDRDVFVRLRDRMQRAQRAEGNLFISLHANNHDQAQIRGASVYTLSENASDAEAAALAAKENKADIIAGINLSDQPEVVSKILIDLAQRETMNLSKHFANGLVSELGTVIPLLRNTHRFAGFAVLKSATVPSVLVEVGYLSNPAEERLIRTAGHRQTVAQAVIKAVDRYFAWQEALNKS